MKNRVLFLITFLNLFLLNTHLQACQNDLDCLNGGTCDETSGICTCTVEYNGTFCEDYAFCGSAIDLGSDYSRDIQYENVSIFIYPDDSTLASGWYYFGKNRFIPTFCPTVGKCLTSSPYWTNQTQPTQNNPNMTTLTICQSTLTSYTTTTSQPSVTSACNSDCSLRVQSVYCNLLDSTIYYINSTIFGRLCYENTTESQLTTVPPVLDPCQSNPCLNGGTCMIKQLSGVVSYECSCSINFNGTNCENYYSTTITTSSTITTTTTTTTNPRTTTTTTRTTTTPLSIIKANETLENIKEISINNTNGLQQNDTQKIIDGLNNIKDADLSDPVYDNYVEVVNKTLEIIETVTNVLENVTKLENVTQKDAENTFKIIDSAINLNDNLLKKSQQQSNTSSRIIETIDNIFLNVKSNDTLQINTTSFKGLSLSIKDLNSSLFTAGIISELGSSLKEIRNNETKKFENITYGAYLSKDVISELEKREINDTARFSIVVHLDSKLFDTAQLNRSSSVNSILSKQVMTVNTNLDLKPINNTLLKLVFSNPFESTEEKNVTYECVYWDYVINNWNTKGCTYSFENMHHTCSCNHTTNFAMLIYINEDKKSVLIPDNCEWCEDALLYTSIIGSCLSILSLLPAFILYLIRLFRLYKRNKGIIFIDDCKHKLLLCGNLLLQNVFYLLFSLLTPKLIDKKFCISIGFLLNVFLLASFVIMFFCLLKNYLMIDKVLSRWVQNFFYITSLVAYTVPIVIALIALLIPPGEYKYISETRCWLNGLNVVYFVIIPIYLIIVCNIILIVLITIKRTRLHKKNLLRLRTSERNTELVRRKEQVEFFKFILLSFIITGLPWIFGIPLFILNENDLPWLPFIFALLFCLFNTILGFVYIITSGILTYFIRNQSNTGIQ